MFSRFFRCFERDVRTSFGRANALLLREEKSVSVNAQKAPNRDFAGECFAASLSMQTNSLSYVDREETLS